MLQDRYSPRNKCRTFQAMSFEGIAFFHALRSIFSLKREALQAIPFFPLTPGRAAQGRPLALPYRPCLPPGAKIFPAPFASRFTSLHKNSIVEPHNVCAGFIHDEESPLQGNFREQKANLLPQKWTLTITFPVSGTKTPAALFRQRVTPKRTHPRMVGWRIYEQKRTHQDSGGRNGSAV